MPTKIVFLAPLAEDHGGLCHGPVSVRCIIFFLRISSRGPGSIMDSTLDYESRGSSLGGGDTAVYMLCPLTRHFSLATSVGWGR